MPELKFDGGLSKIPYSVRCAAAFTAREVSRQCETTGGETALFFHLIAVINQHVKTLKEGEDG